DGIIALGRHGLIRQITFGPKRKSKRDGFRSQVGARDGVEQAERERFLRRHATPRRNEFDGLRHAHQARRPLRSTGTRDDAEFYLGKRDNQIRRADTRIAGERELETTAHCRSVQRRDDWLWAIGNRGQNLWHFRRQKWPTELFQIGPGYKGLPGANHNRRFEFVVHCELSHRGKKLRTQRCRCDIDRRIVDDNHCAVALAFEPHDRRVSLYC
ncbi:MAG: hypothetical protein WBQ55_07645, partial [Xanthobacteraceae bacterium]